MQAAEGKQQWTLTFGSSEIQSCAAGLTSERAIHSATPADWNVTLTFPIFGSICKLISDVKRFPQTSQRNQILLCGNYHSLNKSRYIYLVSVGHLCDLQDLFSEIDNLCTVNCINCN